MAKVKRFDTGITDKPARENSNRIPDISKAAADAAASSAPVHIRGPGNPRPRRYRQKTFSLTDADIERVERLVAEIRTAGLYDRSRSDLVRAGLLILDRMSDDERRAAVEAVENLKR
jgi:Arc/MetJ-type ribon-helix-helix transcriptional regulator